MKAFAEPDIVTRKGKAVSVILPIKDYEEMMDLLEDVADIAWLSRARRKPMHYRSLDVVLAERRKARI